MKYLAFLLALTLAGCGVHITSVDMNYVPYQEKQTLVFDNDKGNTFRLYVLGSRKGRDHKSKSFGTVPSVKVFASSYEGAKMRRRDPPPVMMLMERNTMQEPAILQIDLADYRFSGTVSQSSEWDEQITVKAGEYDDVEIVENKMVNPEGATTAYAERIWWSKKYGLIAFELAGGTRYELKRVEQDS